MEVGGAERPEAIRAQLMGVLGGDTIEVPSD
jgi:hypothetical protein